MLSSEFFYGDNRDQDLVPGDYLKSTMNKFKETSKDKFKCEKLANGFATGSKAEKWFDKLPVATQTDWRLLKAAFLVNWPPETVPELSIEQHRARLRSEKLLKEDVGRVVVVKGMETTGHAAWASRILALSASADDASGAMIHGIREAMPPVMQKLVVGTFKTYKAFCDAVKAVDEDALATAVNDEKRLDNVENETRRLREAMSRRIPDSPTAPLRAAFGNFGVGRGIPRPPAPGDANLDPFAGGPMRGGNIFRGQQRGRGAGVGFRENHLRMQDLTRNTTGVVHHADTAEGRAAYALQVRAWKTANPTKLSGGDEYAPYPLTPGTDPVGSGECFDCGSRHGRNTPHPRGQVDAFETFYRRVANRIIRDDRNATNAADAAGVPANVHLVHVAATDEYPEHWVTAGSFEQGNGNGPEVYVGTGDGIDEAAKPFVHKVQLVGTDGKLVDVTATFDDGALVNAIDSETFEVMRASISRPGTSPRVLRMANGSHVPSGRTWRGTLTVDGVSALGKFEIFPGGGVWQMLLGKPMLQTFRASHEYVHDTVKLQTASGSTTLKNEFVAAAKGSRRNKVAVVHNIYVEQQTLDAYSHVVEHANKRKAAFDKRVMNSRDGVIEYKKGDLVQIQDTSLDLTLSTESKILPRWGQPHRVVDHIRNSYRLETIHGLPVSGRISARRLRRFVPRVGTALFEEQTAMELDRAGGPDEVMEGVDIEEEEPEDDSREEGEVEDVVLGEGELQGLEDNG
ncbi:hypothetical protein C8F01DRAFT_1084159 [Mycena amicta]|nr:hypothetical protein C8F01DRAFT_1084159 [Mycena amicta]